MSRIAAGLLIVVLFPSILFGQSATLVWEDPMDVNSTGQGGLRPRIALTSPGAVVVLWGRSTPAGNFVSVSADAPFTAPIEVSMAGLTPSVADWMGSGIAARGDTVWVVMKATPDDQRPLYVRRSDDGGWTWGDTMRVDPPDGLISRFPSIAIGSEGAPVVQYMQFTHGWSEARQVTTRLTGSAFGEPVQVSSPFSDGEVCDCCQGQVLAQEGAVVALYRNAAADLRVIWGATSMDDGTTFPVGGMLDGTDWVLSQCPASGPDGYITGDSLRYVWMSGAANGTKVYIGSAGLGTLQSSGQQPVFPGQPSTHQQNFPRIAGSGDTLGVVWESNINGQREILFSWSTSGISGMSTPDTVNVTLAGVQRTPDVAFANGAFHIVWNEAGTNQVRYRKAIVQPSIGLPEYTSSVIALVPDPATESITWPADRWGLIEVFDGRGRLLHGGDARTGLLDVTAFPAGPCFVLLRDTAGNLARGRFIKL